MDSLIFCLKVYISTINYFLIFLVLDTCPVKFGLSEKHTKFEKNLLRDFYKSADLLSKH